MSFFKLGLSLWKNEKGAAAIVVAPMLVVGAGMAALSVDTMHAFTAKEQLLTTAQAAASAAVNALPDRNAARQAAIDFANANLKGAAPGTVVTDSDVQFGTWDKLARTFTPAAEGQAANAIRVTASRTAGKGNSVPTIFGSVLGMASLGDMAMNATAVRFDGQPCINALASDGTGLSVSSNAVIDMRGCKIHVHSLESDAVTLDSTAKVNAEEICVQGSYEQTGNSTFATLPKTGCAEVAPDPFADVPPPVTNSYCKQVIVSENRIYILPGRYCNGLAIPAGAVAEIRPGEYRIEGKFSIESGAKVTGEDVFIYLTGSNGTLDFKGGADITLKAQTEGPYAGILFSQDRAFGGLHELNSSVNAKIEGALYFPAGILNLNGSSAISPASSCLMIVAHRVNIDAGNVLGSSSSVTAKDTSLCHLPDGSRVSRIVM